MIRLDKSVKMMRGTKFLGSEEGREQYISPDART